MDRMEDSRCLVHLLRQLPGGHRDRLSFDAGCVRALNSAEARSSHIAEQSIPKLPNPDRVGMRRNETNDSLETDLEA